jgi:glycosyltransferase involved in cell wall biosynthesis
MKTAIVHEWFDCYAGSERVVEQLLMLFPEADLFSLVNFLPPDERAFLQGKEAHTSFLQKLPMARKLFRHYIGLMPLAIEQFDLSSYDLVISSSHAFSKGCLTSSQQLHICYCHTPMRYAWDFYHQYLQRSHLERGIKSIIARGILHYIRIWDSLSARRVDHFIANSQYIARKIKKIYDREARVIYPPVDVESFPLQEKKEDYYLAVARMVPYKRVDIIVDAFTAMPERKLLVIGDGPGFKDITSRAGRNIEFLAHQPASALREYMQKACCYVFAAEEDFGITPVEAMACGTPVVAFGRGGVRETVVEKESGLFFPEQSSQSICDAIKDFEKKRETFLPARVRAGAEKFSVLRFRTELADFLKKAMENHA